MTQEGESSSEGAVRGSGEGESESQVNADRQLRASLLLRQAAQASTSLRDLWARLANEPYEDVRPLALMLADLLEAKAGIGALGKGAHECLDTPSAPSEQLTLSARPKASGEVAPSTASSASPRKIHLFSDGAARGNPGKSGAGAVLKLPDGRIVARLGKYLGIQTNNHAEYSALILGLEAALKLGATEVDATADSQLMVYQLQGRYRVKDPHLKELFDRAKTLMAQFDRATIRHVLREQNKDADEMSNRAIDERM